MTVRLIAMTRDKPRQQSNTIRQQAALLLCTLLVACDGSVQLCGEYACLFYQNDNQNVQQSSFQNDSQINCDDTLFPQTNCEQPIRQCEAVGSIRDRAPDILNQLRQANRDCGSQTAGLNLSSTSQALVWDNTLAQISTNHARDMAANGVESFIGSDGLATLDRVEQAGYLASIVTESVDAGPQTVAEVINNWLDNQTDCEQMLDPRTTRIGMACALTEPPTSGPYWSLLLAAPIE